MRDSSRELNDWLEAAASDELDRDSSSRDTLSAAFRRMPRGEQDKVRKRLLEDCLRTLAVRHGLLGKRGERALRWSSDERRLLEHMAGVLLTAVGLDAH